VSFVSFRGARIPTLAFVLITALCAFAPASARADCTITLDMNHCGGNTSGVNTAPCSSPADCESQIAQAKQTQPACFVYTYNCAGASGAGDAGAPSSIQDATANALAHGMVNGNAQELGTGLLGLGVMAILGGLDSGPAQPTAAQLEAQREAEAAAEALRRRQAAAKQLNDSGIAFMKTRDFAAAVRAFQLALEQCPDDANIRFNLDVAQKAVQFEKEKEEALAELKGGDSKIAADQADDSLKTDDAPVPGGHAQVEGAADDLGLKSEDASSPAPAPTKAPTPKADGKFHPSAAFSKGYKDATGCFSSSAGPFCLGAAADEHGQCVHDYSAGFQAGMKVQIRALKHAHDLGTLAAQAGGQDQAASEPESEGPCRTAWIEAYHQGYFEGKHP
jgi:hypothetical protein